MKIVVLDGHTANPGDLDWSPLAALGALTVHDRTPAAQTLERAAGAQVLLTNKVMLGAAELAALPELRYIGVLATGYNVVDVAAAGAHGIVVTNVPAYSTPSVAQHAFALLLELVRGVGRHAGLVRAGRWSAAPDFAFWITPQVELAGLTFGIVGFGAIGQAVARRMVTRRRGRIINICSVMSELGRPGTSAYTASKGAAKMMTQGIAVDCSGYKINVNAVAPGRVLTGLTHNMLSDSDQTVYFIEKIPQRRIGEPDDIAPGSSR